MVADSSDNNPKGNGSAEKKKESTAGQFLHIEEQGEQGGASAKVGAELHPLDQGSAAPLEGLEVSARSGETDWATAHRRLGHVAMLLLKQLEKDGAVKGLKLNGQPPDENCEICLLSKFTRFPFHSVAGRSKKPLELVHMDLVGPLPVQGHKGSADDWLPFVEKQAECVVKRIRTDRGGEFLGAEMTAWLKKQCIQKDLTTSYTPQSNVAHVPKAYCSKLGASAIWCVHLGLAAESKGWLLWEPSKGVLFDSRDVKFVEGMMYGSWEKQPEARVSQQMEQITMQLDLTPSVWEEGEEAAAEGGDGEKVQEAPAGGGDDVETSGSTGEAARYKGGEQQQGKAKVPKLPQRRKLKGVIMKGWETPVSRPGRTRMATMKLTASAGVAEQQLGNEEALLILPHGYDPDEDKSAYCFLAPTPEEPASMEEALARPNRKSVLRIKTDDKGQVTIYKSRLVDKGFIQKEKQDFNEIFAPTAKPPTLRVLLADAAVSGKFIIQMDISTAFLNGILEEEVFMTQPPGYKDEEMGFRCSSCDESLFLKGEGEEQVLFLVHVDDILLFGSSMKEIQKVQQQLRENFKCKTLRKVKYYLGMHVERDPDDRRLKLYQEKFIKELGEKYGIENERKDAAPLPEEFKLVKAAEDEGLARVVQNPSEEQVDAAERVVKYLNSHPSIGVQYSASAQVKQKGVEVLKEKGERLGEGKKFLTCFTNATRASQKHDSSSVGGYIFVVGGEPNGWRLLDEIRQEQKVATPLFCDSKGALGMAKNAVLHGLNKHLRLK
ncbi:unnamed protein product [Closterium sp. Yama58-4]|nr:unnamed protein product [Closterium sp. Yama58-4]